MWAFSLGSGTSGGVLAPLLMIGGALGELARTSRIWRRPDQALWAAVGMGAMLSGSLGVPLTAILFSLEMTHSLPALLPLMLACIAAYAMTSLIMPRSILTEKLSRRGYHLTREYGIDPLEMVSVVEVMTRDLARRTAPERRPDTPLRGLRLYRRNLARRGREDGHVRPHPAPGDRPRHQPHLWAR